MSYVATVRLHLRPVSGPGPPATDTLTKRMKLSSVAPVGAALFDPTDERKEDPMMRHAMAAIALGALAALLMSGPAFAAGGGAGATVDAVATAYGPSASDNFPYGATDYFGRPLAAGDVAVDPGVIPLGSCIRVSGYRSPDLPPGGFVGQADDEGGAIRGRHVDLYLDASAAAVRAFGVQRVRVTVLGPPTGPGASGTAACAGYVGGGRQARSLR